MELRDRLISIREEHGYSRKQLSDELQVPYGTITKYESGEREPGHSYIVKIAQKFGLTTDYVLGIDKKKVVAIPSNSKEAMALANLYDTLDDWGKAAVNAIIREELARCSANNSPAEIITLPHSLLSASAGTGQWLDYNESEPWKVLLNEHTRKADFAVDVSGDSMEPMFSDGDTVLIHCQPSINEGEIGLFVYQGNGYIKKQGIDRLVSINPEYPDIVPEEMEEVKCVGKALGKLENQWIAQ